MPKATLLGSTPTLLAEAEDMLDRLLAQHSAPPSELPADLRRLVVSLALDNDCIHDPAYWEQATTATHTAVLRIPNLDEKDLTLLLENGTSRLPGVIGEELNRLTRLVNYPGSTVLFCYEVYRRACNAWYELWDSRDLLISYRELGRWAITHPEAKVALALFYALGDECSSDLLSKSTGQVLVPIDTSANPKAALEIFAVLAKDNPFLSITRLADLAESSRQLVSTQRLESRT